jgi:type IV secretion system protein VirB9
MIRGFGFFAAVAVLGCTAASAATDSRIRTLAYIPDKIVQIIGKAGIQSTIEFGPDERIENVAVGDSSKWQITPNHRASMLFVKPLAPRSRTNMTVVTDQRTYMFDLVAGDKWTTPVYALKFSYPNEKPPQSASQLTQPVITAAAPSVAPAILTAEKLHFDWKTKGDSKLLPARVFDDGQAVYLSWSRDAPLPAILTVSEDRKEGPVNYRMSGEYIVISPVPQNLLLRYGKKSAQLWPTHPIVQQSPAQTVVAAGKMASTTADQGQASSPQAAQQQQQSAAAPTTAPRAPETQAANTVKLANMASLYTDKLTDADHEH